jgi:hypothetical protein
LNGHARRVGQYHDNGTHNKQKPKTTYATADEAVAAWEQIYGPKSMVWPYRNAQGEPVGKVLRWDLPDGKKRIRPVSLHNGRWTLKGMQVPRLLYGLPDLANAERVYVCEGEKASDAARSIKLTATTSANGAKSAAKTDWSPVAGKEVIHLPDADDDGEDYANDVGAILTNLTPPAAFKIVRLDGLPDGGDIDDWVEQRDAHDSQELRQHIDRLADDADLWKPSAKDAPEPVDESHDADNEPILPVSIGELIERYPRLRKPVIHGLARVGETCNVVAPSKAKKSWLVYGLLLSIVAGRKWLNKFPCESGRVLLIDNELHEETIAHRVPLVAVAMEIPLAEYRDRYDVVSLRGRLVDYFALGPRVLNRIEAGHYRAIIVDAHYRMLPPGISENDNAEMAQVFNRIDRYADQTGAAWFLVHHTSKGNQAGKNVTDVGSGAGSQSRAADSHIVLRSHEEPDHAVLDAAVRSWPPVDPVTLEWCFPVWCPSKLDPANLQGRKAKNEQRQEDRDRDASNQIAEALLTGPPTNRELRRRTGLSRERLGRLLDRMEANEQIVSTKIKKGGKECLEYQLAVVGD